MSVLGGLIGASSRQRSPARKPVAWVLAVAGPLLIAIATLPFRPSFGVAGGLFCSLLVVVTIALIGGVPPAIAAVVVGEIAGAVFYDNHAGGIVALILFSIVGVGAAMLIDELVTLAEGNAEGRAAVAASRARIVAAGDDTRRQIERDLHDGAQQRLVSLGLALRATQAAVPPELGPLQGELSRVAEELERVQEELREMARGIHPAILAEGGIAAALKTLARRSAIPVELEVRTRSRLPERVEVAAYYVVSEALTNAVRHADAKLVRVELEADDRLLRLSVGDDGVGGADPLQGSGLIGLKDRVEALGGTINVMSPRGAGTKVLVELPLDG
jgi:signal transduction histidine kinase